MDKMALADLISEKDLQLFRTDAAENLEILEDALLSLESAPGDLELIGQVFRAMHTIKGTAGMYGFEEAARFTHHIENYYDRLRNGEESLTKEVIDLTLAATDQLKIMLSEPGEGADQAVVGRITAAFQQFIAKTKELAAAPETPNNRPVADDATAIPLFRIRFRFVRHDPVLANATNPLLYLQSLREMGECAITCHPEETPPLEALEEGICYFYWDILLQAKTTEEKIRGEFIFIQSELAELSIRRVILDPESEPRKIGEILIEQGDVTQKEIEEALAARPRLGEVLLAQGMVSREDIQAALNEQQVASSLQEAKKPQEANVRVASVKLDDLVDQVGELVIAQARLQQLILAHPKDLDLTAVAEEIAYLTEKLRDSAMSMRMLPIGTIFSRFNRLVRDLSQELGKQVTLVTEGGETELDKTVIENLNDPLVHLIRNCIDHGIERPAQRQARGKPSQGMIQLAAIHSGAKVLIRIRDDGQGLDPEAIRRKAVSLGLIDQEAQLAEQELFALIFAPGFSTAEQVTNVSGRGVGMDVVKKAIEGLRGEVEVRSERGQGTTITIILPLTLAIIDGFLVQSADRLFVMPLSMVKECVKLTREEEDKAHGRQIINLRNTIVPYIRLRDLFGFAGEKPDKEQIVITESDGKLLGMAVDRVIGQSQVVIKSLGALFQNIAEFSGATILGNGRVVPILDVAHITATARKVKRATASGGGDPRLSSDGGRP